MCVKRQHKPHGEYVAKMGINWWQEKEKVCKKGFK